MQSANLTTTSRGAVSPSHPNPAQRIRLLRGDLNLGPTHREIISYCSHKGKKKRREERGLLGSRASARKCSSKISPQNAGLFPKIFQAKEQEMSQEKYQLAGNLAQYGHGRLLYDPGSTDLF